MDTQPLTGEASHTSRSEREPLTGKKSDLSTLTPGYDRSSRVYYIGYAFSIVAALANSANYVALQVNTDVRDFNIKIQL